MDKDQPQNSSDLMETLVDFRDDPPHEYRQVNRRIASLLSFSTVEYAADLSCIYTRKIDTI